MIEKGINLIPGEERFVYEVAGLQKKIKALALICLSLAVVGLVCSYLYFLNLGTRLNELSRQTTLTETKIKEMQQKEGYLFLLKNRADLLHQIFKGTARPVKTLHEIEKKLPEGVAFNSYNVDSSGRIKIIANAKDLFLLNAFVASLSDPDFSSNFNNITVSGIGRAGGGSYGFSLELN